MAHSRTQLARAIQSILDSGHGSITETRTGVTVYEINGPEASRLCGLFEQAGWKIVEVSDQGGDLSPEELADSTSIIRIRAENPGLPPGVEAVLTMQGLESLLRGDVCVPVVWVEGMEQVIETRTVKFSPWDDQSNFVPLEEPPDPERFVRVLAIDNAGQRVGGPGRSIGHWLLRVPTIAVNDAVLKPWRDLAARRLLSSIAQEIDTDGRLLFRGPPPVRVPQISSDASLSAPQFCALQEVCSWIFENSRESEVRHHFVSAEVSRISMREISITDLLNDLPKVLESAKIAYGFSVGEQSRDALKSLSDLRKYVTDESSKISETTRGLALAVAGSVFGNLGVLLARVSSTNQDQLLNFALIILCVIFILYTVANILVGREYIEAQDKVRTQWKDKLYRFLTEKEYTNLVEEPAKRAKRFFWRSAWIGVGMVLLSTVASIFIIISNLGVDNVTAQPQVAGAVKVVPGSSIQGGGRQELNEDPSPQDDKSASVGAPSAPGKEAGK